MTNYDWVASTQLAALADGANVTDANIGSVSGLTLDITLAGGGTLVKESDDGSLIAKHNTSGVSRFDLALNTTGTQYSTLIKCTLPTTNPSANSRIIEIMDANGTPDSILRVDHLSSTGQLQLYNSLNAAVFNTTPDISGQVYIAIGIEPKTSTTGSVRFAVYDSTYTLIGSTSFSNDTGNYGLLADNPKTLRLARINTITDTGEFRLHYVRISNSQITPLGPIAAPPTIVLATPTGPYYEFDVRGSIAGGGGLQTYTIAHSSGPNNLSGVREPVDGDFFIPQAATVATYTITDSESGNDDTEVVTVPAISAGTASGGVRRRRWNGSSLV